MPLPHLTLLASVFVWPLVGWGIGAARGLRRPRSAVPYLWTAAPAALVGATLLILATTAEPTTDTEGLRALGIGILGAANLVGASICVAIAAGLRWWPKSRSSRPPSVRSDGPTWD